MAEPFQVLEFVEDELGTYANRPLTPPDGQLAAVLDDVVAFLGRFIAYPSEHTRIAHALWCCHTHAMRAWASTPRLAFLSPEPASGKTRALEISELLVPRPVAAVNCTPAYMFRKVADPAGLPTILHDEIDTVFGPKARENEEIRGLINAGHRPGAVAGRCVVRGRKVETEEIDAYAAVALAGIGDLPDTILTRSIIVRMRRRAPHEHVEPYRRRLHEREGHALRDRMAQWMITLTSQLAAAKPEMPDGIVDRNADVWEPLLAIADAAGGDWPERARVAAVALVADAGEAQISLGVRLLTDLYAIFGEADALSTEVILQRLISLDESPWADIKGKPLNDRGLATRLRRYGIKPKVVRIGDVTPRGYSRDAFFDAWQRYVAVPSKEAQQAQQMQQSEP
jgi:hypothetical protein